MTPDRPVQLDILTQNLGTPPDDAATRFTLVCGAVVVLTVIAAILTALWPG